METLAGGRGIREAPNVVVKFVDIVGEVLLPQLLNQFALLPFPALVSLLLQAP